MMKKSILFILSCFLFFSVTDIFAQTKKLNKKDFIEKYNDLLDKNAELIKFSAHEIMEKKGDKFIVKVYNPDKQIISHLKTYMDKKMKTLDGEYKEWYDDGSLIKEGQFENNVQSGRWNYYDYPKGFLTSYGEFTKGEKNGEWYLLDSLGRTIEKYHYLNGELDGDYLMYDTLAKVYQKKVYQLGEEQENNILDSLYYQNKIKGIHITPVLKECEKLEGEERTNCAKANYIYFVYNNISYPERARKEEIEGKAIIQFVITKEGKVEQIKALRGICSEIEKECIRVIKKSPEWSPGMHDGKAVDVSFKMPVKFKLE